VSERVVRVRALRWEAEGIVSLELEAPDRSPLPSWEPGAHVDLLLPGDRERQYSLCGDPDEGTWTVAVLRERNGRGGSAWIHDELRPGGELRVRGPRNNFALEPAPAYLFLAGGIGITPILPMVRAVERAGAEWTLYYGGRDRRSMAFLDLLAGLGERVRLVPEDEVGRLDLDRALDDAPVEAVVYCCGPAGLLAEVEERCRQRGRELRLERFEPLVDAATARTGGAFEVRLARSGITVTVADGQSILEAVEAVGVNPSCSCLEGTCGSCETPVLEGAVDHRDAILTEAERASGATMMICVSRAASKQLVLDL
jgi:ferredoxin-NADP reductase